MAMVGIQDLHCNAIGSPGMAWPYWKGRRGIRRYYVLGSWGDTVLDRAVRTHKVGADAKAPWTCVYSRYDLLICTLL
jgi:hypothetical protein